MNRRNVLMLSYYCPPAASAGVFRTMRLVKYLPEFGWKPLVLTVRPEAIHHGRLDASLDRLIPAATVVQRTTVLRPYQSATGGIKALLRRSAGANSNTEPGGPPAPQPAQPDAQTTLFRRLVQTAASTRDLLLSTPDAQIAWMAPALTAALPLVKRFRPHVIYSTGPPHSTHLIAIVLKDLTGLPVVTDFRDPWARTEWESEVKGGIRQKVQDYLENLCVRQSSRVILNTSNLRDEFRCFYDAALHPKFRVIPNGYDPEILPEVESLVVDSRPGGNGRSIHLCHPGTVYGRRNLHALLATIRHLTATGYSVNFEQIGDTDRTDEYMRYIRENRLDDCVHLRGRLSHAETVRRMAASDVLVIIQPGTGIQVPGKLFEMLPFRKPIVALTGEGATANIIREYDLGVAVESAHSETIAAAIIDVAKGQSGGSRVAAWEEALRSFDGRRLTGTFAGILDELV